ncbi:MAG: osmotically inducible protein OsmC [Flavobacteriaceae bacterium]|nr:osmotically inducible protein OsmC [Flavobacteriaceae bacterium]
MTSKVKYLGELRTQSTHVASNNSIITDAPIDNHGKGEAFSPTDTVATALASCLLTIMGIKAKQFKIDIRGTIAEVKKIMGENPRRIDSIIIHIHFKKTFDIKIRRVLEKAALTCPVYYSLNSSLKKDIQFFWPSEKS